MSEVWNETAPNGVDSLLDTMAMNGKIYPTMFRWLFSVGIVFFWFGWFGFNGGSALNCSLPRSTHPTNTTNLTAASGLAMWVVMDFFSLGKWSDVAAASGALAGLVGKLLLAGLG
jgi:ammonia channel protein AmtB